MPEVASFESLPVDRQEEWSPTTTVASEPVERRESFDVTDRHEGTAEQSELSSSEKIELAREDLHGRESAFIEHQLHLFKDGRSNDARRAGLGRDLVKGIVGFNQVAQEYGDPKDLRAKINPERSLLDIMAYLDAVIDHDPRFNDKRDQASDFKHALKEQVGAHIAGAKAEFAVADALFNELDKQVFYPAVSPVDEDFMGVDWWVNMGRNQTQGKKGPRQVSALQVKSVEWVNSDKNQIVYPVPLGREGMTKTVDSLSKVLSDDKLDRVLTSLGTMRNFTAAKYPTTHPALVLLNPHDDIDYKTGVLEKHALHRLEKGMAEMLGR
jgi:hypothetical protein